MCTGDAVLAKFRSIAPRFPAREAHCDGLRQVGDRRRLRRCARLSPEGLDQWLEPARPACPGRCAAYRRPRLRHRTVHASARGSLCRASHGNRPVGEDARPGAQAGQLAARLVRASARRDATAGRRIGGRRLHVDGAASLRRHGGRGAGMPPRAACRRPRVHSQQHARDAFRARGVLHGLPSAGRPSAAPARPSREHVRGGGTAAGRAAAGAGRAGPRLGDVRRQDRAARRLDHRAPGRQRLRGRHGKAAPARVKGAARPIVEDLDWFVFRK